MSKGARSVGFHGTWVALGLACLATLATSSCVIDYGDPCPCDTVIGVCQPACYCDADCGFGPVIIGGYDETPCYDFDSDSVYSCRNPDQVCLIDEATSWCAGNCEGDGDCTPGGCCLLAEDNNPYCYPPDYCGAPVEDGGPGEDLSSSDAGSTDDAVPATDLTGDAPAIDGGAADAATDAAATDGGAADAAVTDAAGDAAADRKSVV